MKKRFLLLAAAAALTGCTKTVVNPQKTYDFSVDGYVISQITSEVQEITHDCYLAHCVRGANECYIEVPVNDNRRTLDLVHTGYLITYTLFCDVGVVKVSNNGWELA